MQCLGRSDVPNMFLSIIAIVGGARSTGHAAVQHKFDYNVVSIEQTNSIICIHFEYMCIQI